MNIMRFCQVSKSSIVKRIGRDLILRTHMLREELFETDPGLGWISPESRIRIEMRMLLLASIAKASARSGG